MAFLISRRFLYPILYFLEKNLESRIRDTHVPANFETSHDEIITLNLKIDFSFEYFPIEIFLKFNLLNEYIREFYFEKCTT